ncbi:MAG: MGMT family protein [Clostridiales bacterium]|nr:MGMT family protein [Clostridiales bacterium]
MNTFTEQAIKVIVSVPAGTVLTYGRVALLAGSPGAARQVGWLLNSMSEKYKLPWHRIINAQGKISLRDPVSSYEQKMLLEDEGIEFINDDTISLKKYLWDVEFIEFDQIDLKGFEVVR